MYTANLGLIVGLPVGLFLLLAFIITPFCIIVGVCYASRRRPQTVRTRVAPTTPPPAGTTVITSDQTNETSSATPPTARQHRKPVYKDSQLSYQLPPPSYDAAVAYPPQVRVVSVEMLKSETHFPSLGTQAFHEHACIVV